MEIERVRNIKIDRYIQGRQREIERKLRRQRKKIDKETWREKGTEIRDRMTNRQRDIDKREID